MPPSNPPPVDISVRPPRSQSKRKNCDPENPEGATVTKAKLQSTILDTLSQSKRLKPNCSSHSLKSLLTMNKNISTFGDPKGAKFQAHTGAKKLVIKNLRVKPRENLVRFYASIFSQLKSAVQAILQEKQPPQPLERLYRDVEDICRNGQADALYKDLHEQCELHLQSGPRALISNGAVVAQPIDVLRTVRTHWQNWIGQVMQIRSIFGFLDRSFLLNSKIHPQINDMAITLFRDIILGDGSISKMVYHGINDLVQMDRESLAGFDSMLLKDSIMMLHVVDLYKLDLEPKLISAARSYFEEFSQVYNQHGLKSYIAKCVSLLSKEGARCDAYNFDSSTKRSILDNANFALVEKRAVVLLNNEEVGKLLDLVDIGSLQDLYVLLRGSAIQDRLKEPWETFIKRAGSAIISDQKSDSMVVRLLELKRSLDMVIRDAFNKDEMFKFAMREAYSNFINDRKNTTSWAGNSLVGEVIAKYIDLLLRGGLKAVPRSLASDVVDRDDAEKRGQGSTGDEDAELDRQLEQGLELFRFIEGKDVFEAFYKKDLARRLLMGRSASQDAERSMLTKLKSECGSNFTHNLEQMFKDQELSRDEMISYKQSLSNTSKTTMDLQVSVLSAAAWPTYPDVRVNLPAEVARHIEKFDTHYKQKHTGRVLTWKHSLAHSIVKARFNRGIKELVVSGFQAIVLVLFNDISADGNLSYGDIQSATNLVDDELERTLQSLACTKVRVLTKHPKSREVSKTDTFTINLAFMDPKFRIKINQIQLKETKEENKETHERVALDRQYETQAAIVRIMKSRKTLTHQQLVVEVIEQTKSRGAVEMSEIKTNIEKLIEKDYMEREGGSYVYLA